MSAPTTLTEQRPVKWFKRRVSVQVASGADQGKSYEFDSRVRIGSRPLADFILADPKVSGLHCELVCDDDQLRVVDLGSKNGTFVGTVWVKEARIAANQTIRVGNTTLRVVDAGQIEVPLYDGFNFHGIAGKSSKIRSLTAMIAKVAPTDSTVLIGGETGSGKECVAQAVHDASTRATKPLVIVDCGSLPPNLVEAHLFGWEKGAFTGAVERTAGAFEKAHGGTLFLDEVGELPMELQPKLLRALESRKVRRVGGQSMLDVDVRVIAATNRDLAVEVSQGRFREDLYYRLAVVTLTNPPLRERRDDIRLLAIHLLEQMGQDPGVYLDNDTVAELERYDWPGNVRELKNALERAVALRQPPRLYGTVASPTLATISAPVDLSQPLKVVRQRVIDILDHAYIGAMLSESGWNVSLVARQSGMDRMSIYRIIERCGLKKP